MDTARDHIVRLWPEHLPHLAPEGNKMGQGEITTEGVVCNCGVILGFPKVQDPEEYLAEDTRGAEATAVEAGWNDLQDEPEHQYDPAADEAQQGPPYAVGDTVTVAGIEFTKHSESPFPEHNPTGYVDGDGGNHTYVNPDGSVEAHDGPVESCRCRADGRSPWADRMIAEQPGATQRAADADQGQVEGRPRPYPDSDGIPRDHETPGSPPAVRGEMPARDLGVVQAEDPIAARVVVIDPTLPYGPQDVEHQLLDINGRIERGVHFQRYWEERHFVAKSDYEICWARAMVKAQGGSADVRKAHALLECEDQWRELQLCEAMVRAVRETMHNLRSLQSGYQTVSRSVNDSMRVPGTRP
jgi:hypothetical protein